jgi:hypothetical protein
MNRGLEEAALERASRAKDNRFHFALAAVKPETVNDRHPRHLDDQTTERRQPSARDAAMMGIIGVGRAPFWSFRDPTFAIRSQPFGTFRGAGVLALPEAR